MDYNRAKSMRDSRSHRRCRVDATAGRHPALRHLRDGRLGRPSIAPLLGDRRHKATSRARRPPRSRTASATRRRSWRRRAAPPIPPRPSCSRSSASTRQVSGGAGAARAGRGARSGGRRGAASSRCCIAMIGRRGDAQPLLTGSSARARARRIPRARSARRARRTRSIVRATPTPSFATPSAPAAIPRSSRPRGGDCFSKSTTRRKR